MMRRLPKPKIGLGKRIRATRDCSLGFFLKGHAGTVLESAGDGSHLVRFDFGRAHWIDESEMRLIPERRESVFALFGLAWIRFWRGAA